MGETNELEENKKKKGEWPRQGKRLKNKIKMEKPRTIKTPSERRIENCVNQYIQF